MFKDFYVLLNVGNVLKFIIYEMVWFDIDLELNFWDIELNDFLFDS